MLQIIVKKNTKRIEYVFDFIFKDRGIEYEIVSDENKFEINDSFKLNYSNNALSFPTIVNSSLLLENEMKNYAIKKASFNDIECLSFNGITDPVASIFYILTRMEEYNSVQKDKLNRYLCKYSIGYNCGWHKQAICDRWAEEIIKFIQKGYTKGIQKIMPKIKAIPSFDIDNTFAYKYKGIYRSFLSHGKDLFLGRKNRIIERQKVLNGTKRDPYDTFDKIFSLTELGLEVRVFWLLGDFAKFDRNLSFKNPKQQRLIKKMAEKCQIGIHPSVKSTEYEYYLHNEIERLSEILNEEKITKARQHFLKIQIPETYKIFIQQEINEDFTMGYPDVVGFRGGTARPHYWFDLEKNMMTNLKIHPFCFMDGTLLEYMKLTPEDAIHEISILAEEVKNFGGEFSFIWHNETIGDYGNWKGWSKVFKFSIEKCIEINEA